MGYTVEALCQTRNGLATLHPFPGWAQIETTAPSGDKPCLIKTPRLTHLRADGHAPGRGYQKREKDAGNPQPNGTTRNTMPPPHPAMNLLVRVWGPGGAGTPGFAIRTIQL